jgi:hypothetical protein|tara:strand:- start:767 stop:1120 length:354 start_codon:yes stop_codon:yes gene_type:complete
MIWLKLLSNPITKLIANKTIGAIQHKLEKDKIIKGKEIEAAKELGIEQVKAGKDSLKDEWITLIFSVVFISHFIPALQPIMLEGWNILKNANDNFWYLLFVIVGGSFGMNTINKFKK